MALVRPAATPASSTTTDHDSESSAFNVQPISGGEKISANQVNVQILADALQSPPPQQKINGEYIARVKRAAELLSEGGNAAERMQKLWDTGAEVIDESMEARNFVFDVMNRVSSFVSRAKQSGFSPVRNPFVAVSNLNNTRTGFTLLNIESTEADQIMSDISGYLRLMMIDGKSLNVENHSYNAAQLSSINISLDGFGGSGNVMSDLMRLIPDGDAMREQAARDALVILDFRKRRPRILFTLDYAPAGEMVGAIVAWKKIPDASGYIVKRRNIFDSSEASFTFSNQQISAMYSDIKDYTKTWALSFYGSIDENRVVAMLDDGIKSDGYFVYTVTAYQTKIDIKTSVFTYESRPSSLSSVQRLTITNLIQKSSRLRSPYPMISKQVFGTEEYDWLIAGVNIRASISRNENRNVTRKFSYVSAKPEFLFSQMDDGKFVVPRDVSSMQQRVSEMIATYGVSQVIREILSETGVLYHFDGIESRDDSTFSRVGDPALNAGGILTAVISSIDPESSTLDIESLLINVPKMLGGTPTDVKSSVSSRSKEIEFSSHKTDNLSSEDRVQYVDDESSSGLIDLTTFDGIGRFMRVIRTLSEPNGGAFSGLMLTDKEIDPIVDSLRGKQTSADKPVSGESESSSTKVLPSVKPAKQTSIKKKL